MVIFGCNRGWDICWLFPLASYSTKNQDSCFLSLPTPTIPFFFMWCWELNPGSHALPTLHILFISKVVHGPCGGRVSLQDISMLSEGSNLALPIAFLLCSAICVTRHSWMPPFSEAISSAGMQAWQKSVSSGFIWELLGKDSVSGAHAREPPLRASWDPTQSPVPSCLCREPESPDG